MTFCELFRLDLGRQQYRVILYLAEGEATLEELCQALGVSKAQGYAAVSPLVRWRLVEKVNGRYRLSRALGKGGNRAMPPKNLDPLKDLARAGLRASEYQVLLYLAAAGEAGVEEVMEELGFKRAWAYRALSPLVRRGLVEKEGNKYRLSPALEGLFAPLRRPQGEGVSESG
jgi:DNA-binding IclR family transcriptional regulator